MQMARLTDLYHAFKEFNDKLEVTDPNDSHQEEFLNIQEWFYVIADRVKKLTSRTHQAMALVTKLGAMIQRIE